MRTKRSIINTCATMSYYIIVFLLSIFTRKLTLINIDNRILGYAGTIENIFSWLGMAELGVSTVIAFNLFRALGTKNEDEVRTVMSCYQRIYRVIGIVVLCVGLLFIPCLPLIFVEAATNWTQVSIVYLVLLVNSVSTYFLAFRRALYNADQRGSVCAWVDMGVTVATAVSKILIANYMPVYWIFYLAPVVFNVGGNLVIAWLYHRDYPQIYSVKVSKAKMKELAIFHNTKYFFVRKIASVANSAIDNIVTARYLGVLTVTLVGNYSIIMNRVYSLVQTVLSGSAASIGNLIYDGNVESERQSAIFWSMNRLGFWLASVCMVCMTSLFPPLIRTWIGSEYLLDSMYSFLLGSTLFMMLARLVAVSYREPLGSFETDMWFYIVAAAENIIGSILLVKPMGIIGIQISTVISHVIILVGTIWTISRLFLPNTTAKYLMWTGLTYLYAVAQSSLMPKFIQAIPFTWSGFCLKAIIVGGSALVLNLPILVVGKDTRYLREKLKQITGKLIRRS